MRNRLPILIILAFLLCGCGRKLPEPTLMTVPETESTEPEPTVPETHPDTPEHYIQYVYSEQLREYYTALTGRWEPERYLARQRSPLGAAYGRGDPLENVGFLLEDLDGDGSRELVIGAIRGAEEEPLIFELWTATGEEPELVLCAGEGERYFLLEGESCLIAREAEGSDGAPQLRRRAFRGGALSDGDVEAAPASYRAPRYYPFFLYTP